MRTFVLGSLALLALGCAGKPMPRETLTHPGALLFNGYAERNIRCFLCHNGDGSGTFRAPNLATRAKRDDDDALWKTIHNGDGRMPAFKGKLSDQQMDDLVAWIRSLAGPPVVKKP